MCAKFSSFKPAPAGVQHVLGSFEGGLNRWRCQSIAI